MLWRFPRERSFFHYLERPRKPYAPSMGKREDFLLIDVFRFAATYRHNSNVYPHTFDHGRPEYNDVDVADVGDYRFKMAATKPELEITFER